MDFKEVWQQGWNFYQNKKFQKSLQKLALIDQRQDDPMVAFVMAQCYWQLGQYNDALDYFQKAYDLNRNQIEFSLALIKAFIAEGKKNKAQKIVKQALNRFSDNQALFLYQSLLGGKNIAKIDIGALIGLFNNRQANQNIINLCLACKLFKVNQYSEINDLICLESQNSEMFRTYNKIFQYCNSPKLMSFSKDVLKYSLKKAKLKGHIIEAGVYFGQSINLLAKYAPHQRVIGFDSFAGLPEDWSESEKSGSYSTQGKLPKVKNNVNLIKGWFKDSIPEFIKQNPGPVRFLHIDCDIYSSTKDILNALKGSLVAGTVILFDDFFGYKGYEQHEWKALDEFVSEHQLKIEFIAFCPLGRELAIKILA